MDYGYQHASHVLDFYMWHEIRAIIAEVHLPPESPKDFDLTTEQREGWTYDNV